MSYFGRNIRKIRNAKNISQAQFAQLFNLTRASIGAYEEGRAEAKIDTIIAIAKYFEITTDSLLVKELTLNEIFHLNKRTQFVSGDLKISDTNINELTHLNHQNNADIEQRLANIETKIANIEELLNNYLVDLGKKQ